jgi:hypothetical protein
LAGGAGSGEDDGGGSPAGKSACRADYASGVFGGEGTIGGDLSGEIICSGVEAEASWASSIHGCWLAARANATGEAGENSLGEGGDVRA